MSENEKNIIKAVTEALPKMDERSKEIMKNEEVCKETGKKEESPCQ